MEFAPPSVRDAFARLRSMASSTLSSASSAGGKGDEESAAPLLPESSSAAVVEDKGAGTAQLRGGGGAAAAPTTKPGGLLSSAFPEEKSAKLASSSPSSFLPPPPPPPKSPARSAASLLFGRFLAPFAPSAPPTSSSHPKRATAPAAPLSPFAPPSSSSAALQQPPPSAPSWEGSLITALVVASWYAANTGILLMNKALLSNFGFRRPLLLTLLHMTACALLGRLCRPWEAAVEAGGKASSSKGKSAAAAPPPRSKVAVLAATFCAAVVLGNVSLRYIPVSFAQAIGSTTPAFTAALAFVVLGAREPLSVYATLLPVVGGVVVATGFEPSFDALGFGTAVAATAARSLKAVLQGALLTSNDGSSQRVGSMALLRAMAPVAAAMLLPATLLLEPGGLAATAAACRRSPAFAVFLFANAALSYVVNLTNFVVTKRTSPLTLHVLGNAKGVFATVVSVAVFKNPVSSVGAAGYLSAVGGTLLYGYLKQANKGSCGRDASGAGKKDKIPAARGVVDGAITIKAVAA